VDFLRATELATKNAAVARPWQEASRNIVSHPAYHGLKLAPQFGLVPIGPDPKSHLWEFAHLQSGSPATRDASGRLKILDETGLVFVLVPGGTFRMGAQPPSWATLGRPNIDPYADQDEGPIHDVRLAPFFISKYEMNQAQWFRWVGHNPSVGPTHRLAQGHHSLIHPVESISWNEANKVLKELGLELPTEAQWEYACRAGTTSPWWTGYRKQSIEGAANVADRSAIKAGAGWPHVEEWLDDGYALHAPVDHYKPNPFGLHNVHGNVWEWCRENYGFYADAKETEGDGFREGGEPTLRVLRGGGFYFEATRARSATRYRFNPEDKYDSLGVRPARRVER
jgi:formylglycine-generating enzyme required for sulfatase activity